MEYEYIRNMVLCEGRHEVPPNDGAIFPRDVKNIFDFAELEEIAAKNIPKCSVLRVYVTGLTPCVVAVINVCQARGTELYLLHYDRDEGNYKSQYVDIAPDR